MLPTPVPEDVRDEAGGEENYRNDDRGDEGACRDRRTNGRIGGLDGGASVERLERSGRGGRVSGEIEVALSKIVSIDSDTSQRGHKTVHSIAESIRRVGTWEREEVIACGK